VVCREGRSHFKSELELVLIDLVDEGVNAEGRLVVSVYAIVHDEELSIRGIYYECFHGFKVSQVDTLMEVTVIKYHRSLVATAYYQIVIEHKAQFGIAL
jgi:hypothetical protein